MWTSTPVLAYGAPALGLVLLLATLGISLPATLLLLASGASARQGMLDTPLIDELVSIEGALPEGLLLGKPIDAQRMAAPNG